MLTASEWWKNRRGERGKEGISEDAKFISQYSASRYLETGMLEGVFSQQNELVQDIIDYAMFYFIRDLAFRCRVSSNALPAILTMSSLSDMFIPALFSYNLRRLGTMKKKDYSSRVANIFLEEKKKHEEESSKFNLNLATMIVQDYYDPKTNQYLGKPSSGIPSFGPSMGEIDAAFSLAYTSNPESHTPPVGSSILLIAIAKAMTTIPNMHDNLIKLYQGSLEEDSGFRRAYSTEVSPDLKIMRELTPLFFAACCTQLLKVGKKMKSIQVGSITEGYTDLGTSLQFHAFAFPSFIVPTIRETIVAAFLDTAASWIHLTSRHEGASRDRSKTFPLSLDRVAMSGTDMDAQAQLLDRTQWFFSVVLAMIYAVSPTRENVIAEQSMLLEYIISAENERLLPFLQARGGENNVLVGKEAFNEFVGKKIGRTFHTLPPSETETGSTLRLQKDSPEVKELIQARKNLSNDVSDNIALSKNERTYLKDNMNEMYDNDRISHVPPVVLPTRTTRTTGATGAEQLLMDEEGEEEEGSGQVTGRNMKELVEPELILPFASFPVPAVDAKAAKRLNAPLVLSLELARATQEFARRFSQPLELVVPPLRATTPRRTKTPPKPITPRPEKKGLTKKEKREKREAVRTKLNEIRRILQEVLGFEKDQVSQWLIDNSFDPENDDHMKIFKDLEARVEQIKLNAETELKENSKKFENRIIEINRNWQEAEKKIDELKIEKKKLEAEIEKLQTTPVTGTSEDELEKLQRELTKCQVNLKEAKEKEKSTEMLMKKYELMELVVKQIAKTERNGSFKEFFRTGATGGLELLFAYALKNKYDKAPKALVDNLPITEIYETMNEDDKNYFDGVQEKRNDLKLEYGLRDEDKRREAREWMREERAKIQAEEKERLRRQRALRRKALAQKAASEGSSETLRSSEPIPENSTFSVDTTFIPQVDNKKLSVKKVVDEVREDEKQESEELGFSSSRVFPESCSLEPTALSQALKNADSDDTAFGLNKPPKRGKHQTSRTVQLVLTKVGEAMEETEEDFSTSLFTHESDVHTAAFSTSTLLHHQHRGSHYGQRECDYVDSAIQKYSGMVSTYLWHEDEASMVGMHEPHPTWHDQSSEEYDESKELRGSKDVYFHQEDMRWASQAGDYQLDAEEKDMVWPKQPARMPYSTSKLSKPKTPVHRYGVSSSQRRHYGIPRFINAPMGKKSSKFKEQARSAITMLVAGTLAIASTRIYQSTRRCTTGNKRDNINVSEDDTMLKQLTMPKRFDDSCRKANKESDTIPSMEALILEEWTGLLGKTVSGEGSKIILSLVQRLSGAIETGHSKEAREAMLLLCRLASFSMNVQVTMLNMVKEMHAATSRFRCTNNRNEMMECVKRANAIRI